MTLFYISFNPLTIKHFLAKNKWVINPTHLWIFNYSFYISCVSKFACSLRFSNFDMFDFSSISIYLAPESAKINTKMQKETMKNLQ